MAIGMEKRRRRGRGHADSGETAAARDGDGGSEDVESERTERITLFRMREPVF